MTKIFEVWIATYAVVAAEDEAHAYEVASRNARSVFADAGAPHTRMADHAEPIGPAPARASYLNIDAVLAAARRSGAEAVHPGYGFLAENADFAEAVLAAGLIWVGPPPAAMREMGDKTRARTRMQAAGVPVVPGLQPDNGMDDAALAAAARALGFPLLIKAAAGGGGKGMRVVAEAEGWEQALLAARREAAAAFGDDRVYVERLIARPRHVEIQVLADAHGNVVALGERECSIQRRHQKVIEETPSPALSPALRERMSAAAVAAARAVGYVSAGTVEFIVDEAGNFHFLEMNTRLQVEHAITESVRGIDLVGAQLAIAAGQPLTALPGLDAPPSGHAIEVRLCAEDAAAGFLPATGQITAYAEPTGEGVRVDAGVEAGSVVGPFYDSLLAKVIVHAPDRPTAIARMRSALAAYRLEGVSTNLAFLADVIAHPAFAAGETRTDFISRHFPVWPLAPAPEPRNPWQATDGFRPGAGSAASRAPVAARRVVAKSGPHAHRHVDEVTAPMPGQVIEVAVAPGQTVARGAPLVVLEAMKMEHRLTAAGPATVKEVRCAKGDAVNRGQVLLILDALA